MDDSYKILHTHLNRLFSVTEDLMKKLRAILGSTNYANFFVHRLMEMELPLTYFKEHSVKRLVNYIKSTDKMHQVSQGSVFSCTAWYCQTDRIYRHCDILIGLYFPPQCHYEIGDTAEIWINNELVCTLILNDLNKIYKPFFDVYWLYLIALQHTEIKVITGKTFFAIGICMEDIPRRLLAQSSHRYMSPNGLLLDTFNGTIMTHHLDDSYDFNDFYTSPPYIYAANLIKKHIRQYIAYKYWNDGNIIVQI